MQPLTTLKHQASADGFARRLAQYVNTYLNTTKQINKMAQETYNQWVKETNANQQDNLCGGSQISKNEMYLINEYAKDYILDIGCGTGHRTFPLWNERKLDFNGFEKFQNLIDSSKYGEKIILSDIGNANFQETITDKLMDNTSIAFLFGGVINGIIDKQKQEITWGNLKFILEKCTYVVVDTLSHFKWFDSADNGQVIKLFHLFPPQYFYSKKEIENLNNKYNIEICEELSENIGQLKRTHYLLRSKKN
jgi:SAM-dependent methyltransferase